MRKKKTNYLPVVVLNGPSGSASSSSLSNLETAATETLAGSGTQTSSYCMPVTLESWKSILMKL